MRHLPHDEYMASRPCFFGSIHATLNHIVVVQLSYLSRLQGRVLVAPETVELHADREDLVHAQADADRALVAYCDAADERVLATPVSFTISTGEPYAERVAAVLAHPFVHQVHHRGQVHDLLSATSVPPPQLDELFLMSDRSLRAAECAELGLDDA